MRRIQLLGIVVALSFAAGPALADQAFTPIIGWDQQLFPSYLLATSTMQNDEEAGDDKADAATLGDARGVIGIEVLAPEDDTPVTVTVECNEILDRSTFAGTLESEGTEYLIYPRIRYHYKALALNKQATPVAITFTVKIGDDEPQVHTVNATLRSVNDCPFGIKNDDGGVTDVSYMFAAYVNEQHPFVDKVLRRRWMTASSTRSPAINQASRPTFIGRSTRCGMLLPSATSATAALPRAPRRAKQSTASTCG